MSAEHRGACSWVLFAVDHLHAVSHRLDSERTGRLDHNAGSQSWSNIQIENGYHEHLGLFGVDVENVVVVAAFHCPEVRVFNWHHGIHPPDAGGTAPRGMHPDLADERLRVFHHPQIAESAHFHLTLAAAAGDNIVCREVQVIFVLTLGLRRVSLYWLDSGFRLESRVFQGCRVELGLLYIVESCCKITINYPRVVS